MIGRELLSKKRTPGRYIIDFGNLDLIAAKKYQEPFAWIEERVLPDVQSKADKELEKYRKKKDWNAHLNNWWRHWRNRPDLLKAIGKINRYIVVSRVTKRPIFEFVSQKIHPGDTMIAFPFEDDYSFGVLQSCFHWEWFKARCSTLKGDWRYTGDTVFDSFPWPQQPEAAAVKRVASVARNLRSMRSEILMENGWGLKDLYSTLDTPGKNPLREMHSELDEAVRDAYGMRKGADILGFLLNLNFDIAKKEESKLNVIGPGIPPCIKSPKSLVSDDCIKIEVD